MFVVLSHNRFAIAMPYVKHQGSEAGYLPPVVGAASVPPTQVDVSYEGNWLWDQYQSNEPIAGVTPGQYVSFTCNPTFQAMTDVGQSFIYVQGYYLLENDITHANATADPAIGDKNVSVTAPPFLAACLFQDVSMTINGTQVVASQGIAQPYAMVSSIIKNLDSSDRDNGALTEGFLLDPIASTQITNVLNASSAVRQRMTMQGAAATCAQRPFGLVYRLTDAGLRTKGAWLPPNVNMNIRARRTTANWMRLGVQGEVTNANPVFTFTSATAFIARKVLSEASRGRLENIWADQPLRVPFERIRTSVNWYGAGAQDVNLSNQISGPTPSAVFVFVIQDAQMNGISTGSDNPMCLSPPCVTTVALPKPIAWQNVSLSLGGSRQYPIQPLSMLTNASPDITQSTSSTLDLGILYQLYRACANDQPFLRDTDFTNIMPLCFPITASKDSWDAAEEVSIFFKGRLSSQTPAAYSILIVSFTDSLIEFTKEGQVIVT